MAPTTTTTTRLAPDVQDKLQKLSDHQKTWRDMPRHAKLELLQTLDHRCTNVVDEDDWKSLGAWTAHTMMGIPANTDEGKMAQTTESILPMLVLKPILERLVEAYQMACDCNTNRKTYDEKLRPKRLIPNKDSNQVIMDVFPLLGKDKFGPFGQLNVEWWLDPTRVTSIEEAPEPFALNKFRDNAEEGVTVVLGAGNQSFLTLVDVLESLFVRHRTVLVKHHPLRGPGLDPVTHKLFQPLVEAGFLDTIMDLGSAEANSALVYNPLVTAIHMTGGKATHDAIVWGSTKDEQVKRKKQHQPKLTNAEMTSELGCITPWIMVPAEYTRKQLQHHAECLTVGLHTGASSNCLSPKVIVMDEAWGQKEEFVECLRQAWTSLELPVAYYPGCQMRWDAYQKQYPSAISWGSNTGRGILERQLVPPMMNAARGDKEATLLPLLCVDVKVDLTTEQGQQAAKTTYAFREEPFCPVVTFAMIQNTTNLADYMETAVSLCNNYIYGSLSCSLSVPTSVTNDPSVQTAIANLKYGSIGINVWTGYCYQFSWGGHASQERLENVESGIGRINNYLFLPHLEKSVVKAPFVWHGHPKANSDPIQAKRELDAVGAFIANPGVVTFVKLITAKVQIPKLVIGATVAAAVGVTTYFVRWGGSAY